MHATISTLIILAILICIIFSLGYSLFFLLSGKGQAKRTAAGLTMRIGLSMALFVALLLAINKHWIHPNPLPLFNKYDQSMHSNNIYHHNHESVQVCNVAYLVIYGNQTTITTTTVTTI